VTKNSKKQQPESVVSRVQVSSGTLPVKFVEEEYRLAFGRLNVFQNTLEALFELAAHTGACRQRRQIQRQDSLVLHGFGHFTRSNALCEPLRNGSLSDPRIANDLFGKEEAKINEMRRNMYVLHRLEK